MLHQGKFNLISKYARHMLVKLYVLGVSGMLAMKKVGS